MNRFSSLGVKPSPLIPLQWPSWKLKTSTMFVFVIEVIVLAIHPTIFQDLNYHDFADGRTVFQVRNFWNLSSNLAFLGVGLYGLYKSHIATGLSLMKEIRTAYNAFFIGISLVAFGSAYYHLHPDNYTLVWDRLPMTIAFMALLSITFAEFMSDTVARIMLWPLLLFGVFSVAYWYYGELHAEGDLRLYAFVQMTPVLMIPMFLVTGKRTFDSSWGYWALLTCYVLSKLAERFDDQFYVLTFHTMGGHAIKHFLIAIGLFLLIKGYEVRKPVRSHFRMGSS